VQAFITALVRPIIFLIPAVLLMSHLWQLDGVFLAFPISDVLTLLLVLGLLSPIINQFRRLAKEAPAGTAESLSSSPLPGPPRRA
jgi:Na+-driven multidrug efflux pump